MNVAWVQACFAAIGTRPEGFRADQANACRIGIVVHLPLAREKRPDVLRREEVGRAVRTVKDADLPRMLQPRLELGQERTGLRRTSFRLADMENVTGRQRAAAMASELAERERRAAAEIERYVDATSHCNVRSGARTLDLPDF